MDLSQMKIDHARHERHAEPGRDASAARAIQTRRQADPRRGRGRASRRCSASPRRSLGVAGREPDASARASSRAAARPSPTARCSATSCSTSTITELLRPPATPRRRPRPSRARRARSRSASTSSSARARRRASTSRTRSPASYTYVQNIRVPGHAPRPRRPAARPGRLRRRHGAEGRLGRRELDQAHRGREGRPLRRTSSASSRRQEYAAIQAAAQLKVKWADPPELPGTGNLFKHDARPRQRAGKAPARIAVQHRATSTPRSRRRAHEAHADATSTTTTGHLPIGPSCCVADVTPNGARIFSNTQDAVRHASDDHGRARRGAGLEGSAARTGSALTYYEGSSVYGVGAVRRREPGGGDHVGAGRQAGAAAVHALGRARLGQLRPGAADGHPRGRSTRTASIIAFEFTALRHSRTTRRTPAEQQVHGQRGVRRRPAALETTISGAQYSIAEPAGDRQEPAAAEQLLQGRRSCGRRTHPQTAFAAEQADRRAGVHGEDGPGRVPAPERREH